MENELEETKKSIMSGFDDVVKDSEAIRAILSQPGKLSSTDLDFVKARIGNNKTINVALNGKISVIRLTDKMEKK